MALLDALVSEGFVLKGDLSVSSDLVSEFGFGSAWVEHTCEKCSVAKIAYARRHGGVGHGFSFAKIAYARRHGGVGHGFSFSAGRRRNTCAKVTCVWWENFAAQASGA